MSRYKSTSKTEKKFNVLRITVLLKVLSITLGFCYNLIIDIFAKVILYPYNYISHIYVHVDMYFN